MNYIERLRENNKDEKFVKLLKFRYPRAHIYLLHNNFATLTLLIRDEQENFLAEYILSSYDCKASSQNVLKMEEYNKRNRTYLCYENILRAYLKYMIDNFEDYKEDYLNSTNRRTVSEQTETY